MSDEVQVSAVSLGRFRAKPAATKGSYLLGATPFMFTTFEVKPGEVGQLRSLLDWIEKQQGA